MEAGINDGFFFRERFLQIRFDPRHCSRRYDPIAKNKGGRIVVPFALNAKRKKKKEKTEKNMGDNAFLIDREIICSIGNFARRLQENGSTKVHRVCGQILIDGRVEVEELILVMHRR